MNVQIKPTQDPQKLSENLEERVQKSKVKGEKVIVQIDEENKGLLDRTPGILEYKVDGEKFVGLEGRPVQEKAYVRIEDERDVAEALLATIEGYDLIVLDTGLEWDLRLLRRFNPDIKHLTSGRSEIFDVEKTLEDEEDRETIQYDISDEEVDVLNRFIQPKSLERGEN